ncbi:MAG TPA: HAD family phosphatase [Pseudomonadales bacterium]
MSTIDAVLFDFGGVFTVSPFHAVMDYASSLGGDPQATLQLVFGDYGVDGDHPWHRLERGEMTLEAARDAILERSTRDLGQPIDLYSFLMAMASDPDKTVRQPMIDYATALRREGRAMAIITNNVLEFKDAWRGMMPVDELFDAVIDSSEVGVRKPHPDIYRMALDQMNISDPARAVFLDDLDSNVDAARALGMHGIRVDDDYRPAMQALNQLLGR